MKFYKNLPYDIIEYVSRKIYKEFSDKIKKKHQIKKDFELAYYLETETKFQYFTDINYINNVYNNYNNNTQFYYINNINNYNNNIYNDSDSETDYSSMPELESIYQDTEVINN